MSLSPAAPGLGFLADAGPLDRKRRRRWLGALGLLSGTEAAILVGSGIIATLLLPRTLSDGPPSWGALVGTLVAAAAWAGNRLRPRTPAIARVLTLGVAAAIGGSILALLGRDWRAVVGWTAEEVVVAGLVVGLVHAVYRERAMLAGAAFARQVAVIGDGPVAQALCARLRRRGAPQVRLVGRYRFRDESAGDDRGPLRALLSDCRLRTIDAIVLALEPEDRVGLERVQRALLACVQDIYFAADLRREAPAEAREATVGGTKLLLVRRAPLAGWRGILKGSFDRVVAAGLIAFMAPLLLAIAVAIRAETRGPILFRQLRVGYNNQLFYILKFRSMYLDTTDRLAKTQTVRGDKRITRVGRVIRRLSLDELPQLLNVLRGEMSLVGPRPHAPGTSIGGRRVHLLVEDYPRRHLVRPGMTGLAQVRGLRGGLHDPLHVRDRVAADLEYIERWSLWLDIKILLGTVFLEMRDSRGV